MSQTPGPDFTEPAFIACYRHPERRTGISCQRCRKPICGECMHEASVGFQCPSCVRSGRASVRAPQTSFGATLRSVHGGSITKVLMGVLVALFVINFISGDRVLTSLGMFNAGVYGGQFWRLFTYAFTSVGLLGLLMNLLVLWMAGRAIEGELGAWRFVLLYLTAGLGGATVFFLIGPWSGLAFGASTAIIGLLAANAAGKLKAHEDIRPDVSLLILIVLYNVLVGFSDFGWAGLIGGIAVGALVGAILVYAPRERRTLIQILGLAAVWALCLAAVVAKLTLA